MKCLNRTLAFDFGSSNTVVCENGQVIYDEPTEVAMFSDGAILIGAKARIFYSGEPKLIKPIVHGYVNDYDAFEVYVKGVVKKLVRFPRLCLKTVIIAIPNDLVGDENASVCDRAFFEPFRKMGVKNIKTIHKSDAAFLGSQMRIQS